MTKAGEITENPNDVNFLRNLLSVICFVAIYLKMNNVLSSYLVRNERFADE